MPSKKNIALIRGDSLNEWEGLLWNELSTDFSITAFCSKRNLYDYKKLAFPVKRLRTSSDNKLCNAIEIYGRAHFQHMYGLDQQLSKFDVVHTAEISYFYTTQAVRAKKKYPKLKVVTTVWDNSFGRFDYGYTLSKFTSWRNRIKKIIAENIRGVDLFLPVSEYSAGMLVHYGVPEKHIEICRPAIILDRPSPGTEKEKISNLLGQDLSEKKVICVVSRLVKEKGVYDILYAWKQFKQNKSSEEFILLIVGKGPEKIFLLNLIDEIHISDVYFIDEVPNRELRMFYSSMYCLILASFPTAQWQEQFGFVLAEAIFQHCPVISTMTGAIPEVVGSAGLLIPPANPLALYEALIKIAKEEEYQRLKKNCEREREKFMPEMFIKKMKNIYTRL